MSERKGANENGYDDGQYTRNIRVLNGFLFSSCTEFISNGNGRRHGNA